MDARDLLEITLTAVLQAALRTVPLFLVVLVITSVSRRWLAAHARYALWSIVLLRLLLPASIASPFSMQPAIGWAYASVASLFDSSDVLPDSTRHKPALSDVLLNAQENGTVPHSTLAAVPQVPETSTTTFLDGLMEIILPVTILLGMLLMAAWTIITTVRLYRRVAAGTECRNEEWLALLAEGQQLFGVSSRVTLRTVPGLICPATCGWWRPAILLPADAATWSTTELRHVFWHELAHISRHDVASNWLLAIIRVLHWWNPLFWYSQNVWMAEREQICDALVLRFLKGQQSSEYGRTLLRFLERLNHHGRQTSTTPGFVNFLGQKRVIRRRLEQLGRLHAPESGWRKAAAATLILALILSGLTDAAIPPRKEARVTPIDLPPGTTLRFLNFDDVDPAGVLKVVTYDLAGPIARFQKDNPELTVEDATKELRRSLQSFLDPSCVTFHESGTQLVVRSTDQQRERIRSLLSRWAEEGRSMVQIDMMILTTEGSLKELLPEGGGEVVQTGGDMSKAGLDFWNYRHGSAHSTPVFRQVLTPQHVQYIMTKFLQNPRRNVLCTPKVTVYDGSSATISNGSLRPFVTGLPSDDKACQVTVMPDGRCLNVQPLTTAHQSVDLNIQIQRSDIRDVELLQMQAANKTVMLQLPQVSQTEVNVTSRDIPAEHSLLVAPLCRDLNGQLEIYVITPRQVQKEQETRK